MNKISVLLTILLGRLQRHTIEGCTRTQSLVSEIGLLFCDHSDMANEKKPWVTTRSLTSFRKWFLFLNNRPIKGGDYLWVSVNDGSVIKGRYFGSQSEKRSESLY